MAKRGPKKIDGRRGRKLRMEPMVVSQEAVKYGIRAPAALPPGEKFISPNQAGRILNVTGEAVKQWIYHRRLPATKLSNGYWKIKVRDLEDFIKARQNLGQKKIMVIDSIENSGQIAKAIEDLGHQIIIARNRADALLKAADLYPSLFVVNVSIADFDAWELLARIRNTRNIRNAPVLAIADRDLKEKENDRALELNVQSFLVRPFKTETLVAEFEKIIQRIL